jgi:hypothetical protein
MEGTLKTQVNPFPKLSPKEQRRLRQLGEEGDARKLTAEEQQELKVLIEKYDWAVLHHALGFAMLSSRGDG